MFFAEEAAETLETIALKLGISEEMVCFAIIDVMETYTEKRYSQISNDLFSLLYGNQI